MVKKDITSRADIELLVDRFYDQAKIDPLLGPPFSHVNWETHLPVMYRFWSSLVLDEHSYQGNPLSKHISLPVKKEHFANWIKIFVQTVDEHFAGVKAEEIKMRANNIAQVFQHKMNLIN